jgi:quinol-cytochrome oxidoreductase complex cytochrome b subunit
VEWLWGGFSVDNATLNRFFSLHYLLPFVIAGRVGVHIVLLHHAGSNNPLGTDACADKVPFYPYFVVKDALGGLGLRRLLCGFVFWSPNTLGHTDNYILANPRVTPAHIVPEWYFLPFYAILRSIPNKLGGVIARGGALVILRTLPYTNRSRVRSAAFRPVYRVAFWRFVADAVLLGWIGQCVVEYPYVIIGQVATAFYFVFLLVRVPGLGWLETRALKVPVHG